MIVTFFYVRMNFLHPQRYTNTFKHANDGFGIGGGMMKNNTGVNTVLAVYFWLHVESLKTGSALMHLSL